MSASAAIGDPLILCAKRRILIMKKKMTKSSGNVFVDLGLSYRGHRAPNAGEFDERPSPLHPKTQARAI